MSAERLTAERVDTKRVNGNRMDRRSFLSEAECRDILKRISDFAVGGGETALVIASKWSGNIRWARNQVSSSGDVRSDHIIVSRNLNGAYGAMVNINKTTDAALVAAARRAERLARLEPEAEESDLEQHYHFEPIDHPVLFSDATYQLESSHRAAAARQLAQSATDAGMLSAGYIEVSANSIAQLTTAGEVRYFPYTSAQCTMTVRDPQGTGSGWAGVDHYDWSKIDGPKLAAIALEKCLKSRNPVRIEPGRYTVILEPQAVCDFMDPLVEFFSDFDASFHSKPYPFNKIPDTPTPYGTTQPFKEGVSKLGEKVIDERLSIRTDLMDPELGFPPFGIANARFNPFDRAFDTFHAADFVTNGVLTGLGYSRHEGITELGVPLGREINNSYRMTGGTTSIDEMIATTKRGLLVTRFSNVSLLDSKSVLCTGYTRDGLWFIENGKISKPAKNLKFTESPLFALNQVQQLGVPQRVYHPGVIYWWQTPVPVIVPPLKVGDFSFTALTDAV